MPEYWEQYWKVHYYLLVYCYQGDANDAVLRFQTWWARDMYVNKLINGSFLYLEANHKLVQKAKRIAKKGHSWPIHLPVKQVQQEQPRA